MLLRRNIKTTRPSDKLDYRKLGPFSIVKAHGPNAYLLELPPSLSRLHPVFNVNLLEPYSASDAFPDRANILPPTSVSLEEGEGGPERANDIQEILDVRKIGRRFDYLVDFKGQPISDRTWLPLSDISSDFNEMIVRFHRRHTKLPKPTSIQLYPVNRTPSNPLPPPIPIESTSDFSILNDPIRPIPRVATPPPDRRAALTSYVPPPVSTSRSGRVVRPRDLDKVTRDVTSNPSVPSGSKGGG